MSGDCFCSPCIYRFIHSHFSVPHFTFMSITAIHNTTLVSKTKTLNASLKRYITNNTWKWTTLLLSGCDCLLYLDYLYLHSHLVFFCNPKQEVRNLCVLTPPILTSLKICVKKTKYLKHLRRVKIFPRWPNAVCHWMLIVQWNCLLNCSIVPRQTAVNLSTLNHIQDII